jgi:putative transposase
MARPIRIEYAGALYHVTSRGDRREDIFLDDNDRLIWLAIFADVCSRFNWRCHTWCLMDNHYHIVVETIEGNLAKGMRHLNGVYTQKSNRRHQRVGHVFQGRYKAILVQKNCYLLELSRYVVLNPVRAQMVNDVSDWQWSSFHAMLDFAACPEWLETDWLLSQFGDSRQLAVKSYINFVRAGVGLAPIWSELKQQVYLGDDAFITQSQAMINNLGKNETDLKEIPRIQRRSLAKSLSWYEQNAVSRDQAIVKSYASGDYTMKDIADWFGVHYSTVSRVIKRAEILDCKT